MSFDVYAGPLCRYFARDFVTPTQRLMGSSVRTIRAGEVEAELPTVLDVQPIIRGWQRLITPRLKSAGVPVPEWNELGAGLTFAEQLTAPGYWAARLVAAYIEFPDLAEPTDLPPDDELAVDPALARLRGNESRSRFAHFHACEWWLPLRMAEPLELELPNGNTQPVGSTSMLKAELESLLRGMGSSVPTPINLGDSPSAPEGASPLRTLAWHAVTKLHAVADSALGARVPMLLDY